MEEKYSSESVSLDINSETDSLPFINVVNTSVDVPQLQPQPQSLNMSVVTGSESGDLMKKKRGRPRKYDADGNLRVPALSASPTAGFSLNKSRGRGRPPGSGSGNWQLLASLGELFADTAGRDFTPHVINVYTGEDVASKILSLFQKGARGICVLSANGTVSNVTICQPGSSGGILTYEGQFEILSLTGSFTISENGGVKGRTGGLSVSLAGPDGRVIGGGIAGKLIAASPIQSVVGSFMPDAYKMHKRKQQYEARMVSPIQANSDVAATSPNIQASAETNVGQFLPSHFQVQNHVEAGSINKVGHCSADWNGSKVPAEQKQYPDINMSAPDE